jgi:hypothetical protein
MKLKGRLLDLHLDYVTHRPKLVIELQGQDNLGEYGKLKEEQILDIDITKPSAKRSLNANAYLHLLLNKLARHYDVADDEIKIKMNLQYGTIATDDNGKAIGCKMPKGTDIKAFYPYAKWYKTDKDYCDCYLFYKQTHTLTRLEFSKLLNGVVMECKDVGIDTLDDIELNRLIDSYNASNTKQ